MSVARKLEHRYSPWGSARGLFECREAEVLLSGPAGTGKSRACLEKLHMLALINPGMRGLIVRKTLSSLGSTALVTWREQVAVEALGTGEVQWYGGSPQESAQYRYRNGSVIVVGGMDRATKIMSSEYDVIYVQEATELTVNDWEALTTRLRNWKISFQQLMADCNPDAPTHWLKARCDAGGTRLLESRHEHNPTLFGPDGAVTVRGADYLAKLDALTGVRYLRLRKGVWAAADGLIYDEYDPAVHLVDRFEIPDSWTRWWAVDFGFTNPFVCQWWAEDPDGRLFLYRELYQTRQTTDQHARAMLKAVTGRDGRWREPKPRGIVCDHDAEGRAVLERELGLSTSAARKTVTDGIQAVQARLRPAGDGRPRLFLMRDSLLARDPELEETSKPTSSLDEIVGYIWADTPGKPPKEEPRKEDDHGMDAMRYVVAERDLGVRPRVRWM